MCCYTTLWNDSCHKQPLCLWAKKVMGKSIEVPFLTHSVHVLAKFHQAECSSSWVIVLTEKDKNSDENNTVHRCRTDSNNIGITWPRMQWKRRHSVDRRPTSSDNCQRFWRLVPRTAMYGAWQTARSRDHRWTHDWVPWSPATATTCAKHNKWRPVSNVDSHDASTVIIPGTINSTCPSY